MTPREEVKIDDLSKYSCEADLSSDGRSFDFLNQVFPDGIFDDKIANLKSLIFDRLRQSQYNPNLDRLNKDLIKVLLDSDHFDIKYSETHDNDSPPKISIEIVAKRGSCFALFGFFGGKDKFRSIIRQLLSDYFPPDLTDIYIVSGLSPT
jgi:hypothetical protein